VNASATALVGQLVSGRYRIEKLIGEGGMGAVYLAEHTHMRKRVALKLLHAEMSADEEVLARFRREAEAAAHVEHPNVASATDFGQLEDGSFFLVLEYVEGRSLRSELDAGPIAPRRVLHISRQMCLALERAHAAGIVHRDLKPENVMLVQKADDPDFVKVLDFGIAKIEAQSARAPQQALTKLGTILGTPEYMAPEQALGEAVTPSADLYAVGVMMYEMLTGKHPFDTTDRMAMLSMHIVAPVPVMAERNAAIEVPPPIEQVVRQLLEKDAKARPANARALIDAIDTAAGQCGIELTGSTRSLPRESYPGISPPPSSRVVQEEKWSEGDALAKTSYGLPAVAPSRPRPPWILPAAIGGGALVLGIVIVAIVAGGSSHVAGGPEAGTGTSVFERLVPKPSRATPDQVRAAAAGGPAALEELQSRFPEDAVVAREIAVAYASAGRTSEALKAARAASKLEAIDDAVLRVVVTAATRPDTADEAFALMEGPLGARGVDGLIEIAMSKTIALPYRNRANKSLGRTEVRANATPAAGILIDFKTATACAAKRDLLDRVKTSGDARMLALLKTMKTPRGCGFMGMRDCWPCLRKDDALDEAIRALEEKP
jgi:eukaryotic-like serine/threonine-protein kinase